MWPEMIAFRANERNLMSTIINKIFAKNSSFHVKLQNAGKVSFLFLSSFLLESAKFLFWERDWALDLVLNFEVF